MKKINVIFSVILLLGGCDSSTKLQDFENGSASDEVGITTVQLETTFQDHLKSGGFGPEMVVVPSGRFQMGDIQGDGYDTEKPVHWVNIESFAIGKYEVTFAEYDKFAQATGEYKLDDEGWGRDNRPVIHVSWHEATAYTKWLSQQTDKQYRLPSEAEWEYAARAGTETKYWWGNDIGINKANCDECGSQWDNKKTAPVGSFDANPFGLYDTVGNVWEWVADGWHENYTNAPNDGRAWVEGVDKKYKKYREFRSGSWQDSPGQCRAANRIGYSDYWYTGFRVVTQTY